MDDTYKFEELEIKLNDNTVVYVSGEVDYEANWSCGDFDYEGPRGTATHKVGMEMDDLSIDNVYIESFRSMTKVDDMWVEVGSLDIESDQIDKDLAPALGKLIKENERLIELASDHAQSQGVGEPDKD